MKIFPKPKEYIVIKGKKDDDVSKGGGGGGGGGKKSKQVNCMYSTYMCNMEDCEIAVIKLISLMCLF